MSEIYTLYTRSNFDGLVCAALLKEIGLIDEIKFALLIGKPVVAIKITEITSSEITSLKIPVIPKRKDSLESWILFNVLTKLK